MPAKPDLGDYRTQVVKYFFQTPRLFHYRSTFRTYLYRNEALPALGGQIRTGMNLAQNFCAPESAEAYSIGVVIGDQHPLIRVQLGS